MQPTSVFSQACPLNPELQFQFLAPALFSGHMSQTGTSRVVVLSICVSLSLIYLPQTSYCAFLWASEAPFWFCLILSVDFPGWGNISSSSAPFRGIGLVLLSLSVFTPWVQWRSFCLFKFLRFSISTQYVFCENFSIFEVFLMYLWGEMNSMFSCPLLSWKVLIFFLQSKTIDFFSILFRLYFIYISCDLLFPSFCSL